MSNKIKIGARVKTLAKEKGIALYSLTERGKSLIPILDGMCEWGDKNRIIK